MRISTRVALVLLHLAVFVAACAGLRAAELQSRRVSPGTGHHIVTSASISIPAAVATSTPAATPTISPPLEPTEAPSQSEVLPAVVAPPTEPAPAAVAPPPASPPEVRGGTSLLIPGDTAVVWGGCASDGECHWYNFYWAPTHEVVMQNGESVEKVQHELCHAHQHWTINRGAPLAPSNYDLHNWYVTAEGESFQAAVAGLPWPWSDSAINGIEDFAWTCAYWYRHPSELQRLSPDRYNWAAANLP